MTIMSLIGSVDGAGIPATVVVLKATGLILVAATLALILRRASAEARHQVWFITLIGLLLLPVLALWSPIPIRVLPDTFGVAPPVTPPPALLDAPAVAVDDPATSLVPVIPSLPATPEAAATPNPVAGWEDSLSAALAHRSIGQILFAVWLTVMLLLLAKLGHGWYQVRRIVRRAEPLRQPTWLSPLYDIADRMALDVAPRLLRSTDVEMPFACGILSATIVLPAESDTWSVERRSAVLIHELGHIKRRDLIGHTLGRIICAIYWFHPMAWDAARHLRDESERACDDLALLFGARPSEYAEHLLDIVIAVRHLGAPSIALALAHRKEFEGRMLAILDPQLHRSSPRRLQKVVVLGFLALFSLVLAAAAPALTPAPATPVPQAALAEQLPRDKATKEKLKHMSHSISDSIAMELDKLGVQLNLGDLNIDVGEGGVSVSKHSGRLRRRDTGTAASDEDDPSAVLAKVLHTDSSAAVRRVAAWGLHQYLDNAVATSALIDALARDADADVRKMSAWSLAEGESDAGAQSLVGALQHDKSEAVREMSAWGLGERASNSTADALGKQLLAEHSAIVRATLAWALGQMDLTRAPKGLIDALSDSVDDVRFKASWALSEIGDSAALPALRRALAKEHHAGAQRAETRALIVSGEAPEGLASLMSSTQPDLRMTAVRALVGQPNPGSWPWPWPRPIPIP